MPQTRRRNGRPRTLHLAGEFIESNLGSAVEPDGSVIVRAIGQQYSFTPHCILVPADTPVTFRATSADVVHGFLIDRHQRQHDAGPGLRLDLRRRASPSPASATCPATNSAAPAMKACGRKVKIIDKAAFQQLAASRRRLSCVE